MTATRVFRPPLTRTPGSGFRRVADCRGQFSRAASSELIHGARDPRPPCMTTRRARERRSNEFIRVRSSIPLTPFVADLAGQGGHFVGWAPTCLPNVPTVQFQKGASHLTKNGVFGVRICRAQNIGTVHTANTN